MGSIGQPTSIIIPRERCIKITVAKRGHFKPRVYISTFGATSYFILFFISFAYYMIQREKEKRIDNKYILKERIINA